MAYTAQQLITNSWFLSGIVARNLQYPTGDQINDGLQMLNDLLNFKQIEVDLIPYYQYITFDCVPSQEYYFLPGVALMESMTFNLDVVRYPMAETSRTNYYGSARVDNISTLPFSYNYNRALQGGNLALYFKPDSNYRLKAMVKTFFTDVSLQTDLTDITTLNGEQAVFSAAQITRAFTVTNTSGHLVINAQLPMSLGEQVQFTGGSIPSTLSLATTYYAVPINQATFYAATTLTNALAGTYVAYAAGTGNVTPFALVITLPSAINDMFVGDEIIFSNESGALPTGLIEGIIYYANPSSPTTLTVATTLLNAQSGDNILYTDAGTGVNTINFINPDNIPNYTYYTFINNSNQGYDLAYIEFLRYSLSAYMCSEYGIMFNPESQKILDSYKRKLMYESPPDLSMKKLSILGADGLSGFNWGDVNIGHGWRNT